VYWLAIQDRTIGHEASGDRNQIFATTGEGAVMGDTPDELSFSQEHRRVICPAHPNRVDGDRIEGRLELRRRAGDHPQDLAGRCLLALSLTEFAVPCLQLVQRRCQALLQVAEPGALVLRGLSLTSDLSGRF